MLPLVNLFEKLINEHGSSQILRDGLGRAKDEIMLMDRKLATATEEIAVLKSENQTLKSQVEELQQICNAHQEIQEASALPQSLEEKHEVEIAILKALFDSEQPLPADRIGGLVGKSGNNLAVHIDALKESNLIDYKQLRVGSAPKYGLTVKGRKMVAVSLDPSIS